MSRTFENFPEGTTCPVCSTNKNGECFLAPIDGTDDDGVCEAIPVHVECINLLDKFRFNKEHSVLYARCNN